MRMTVALAVACLIIGMSVASESDASIKKYDLNIPRQSLDMALKDLAQQTGLQIARFSDIIDGSAMVGPVSGSLTTQQALQNLLSTQGLSYKVVNDRTIAIVPLPSGPAVRPAVEKSTSNAVDDASSVAMVREGRDAKPRSFWSRFRLAQTENPNSSENKASDNSSEASSGDSKASGSQLEEIVVTAQKREERLQDVPMPVTAIDADSLVNSHQLRLQDYYARIPGLSLTIDSGRGGALVALRGITTGFSNPTVSIVVDDVPHGPSTYNAGGWSAIDVDPADLARVEVLRGPQGTLYGASSLGGLIKYVTLDPTTEGISGRIRGGITDVSHGDDIGHALHAAINLPLSETWALRASAYSRRDPGYIDDPVIGAKDVNVAEARGARLSTLWRPSDVLSLKLNAFYQRNQTDGSSAAFIQSGFGDFQHSHVKGSGGFDKELKGFDATLNAQVGRVDLTAVSGYNVTESSGSFDATSFTFGSNFAQSIYGVHGLPWVDDPHKTAKFTQELRLSAPIGERFEWLAGAFYLDEKTDPYDGGWIATDFLTGTPVGTVLHQSLPSSFTEYALFANLAFHVTNRFDLEVGGRRSQNRQAFQIIQTGPWITDLLGLPAPLIQPEQRTKDSSFTYLLTPQFRISPDLMMYARFSSGYRPGGGNGAGVAAFGLPPTYGPDTTQNYEIGVKGTILDSALSFDTSLYYIDWKDIQTALISEQGSSWIDNVSRAKSQGLELSVQSRPLRGLSVAGWVAWNDATVTDIPANSLVNASRGERLPYSSRFSGRVSLDQEFTLGGNVTPFAGVAVSYVGERPSGFPFGSTPRTRYPSYVQTDVRLGAKYDAWTVELFVSNLTDERGLLTGGPTEGNPISFTFIQPRTTGLSVSTAF